MYIHQLLPLSECPPRHGFCKGYMDPLCCGLLGGPTRSESLLLGCLPAEPTENPNCPNSLPAELAFPTRIHPQAQVTS
jgi:hypothetical protein